MGWIDASLLRALRNDHHSGGAFGWIFLVAHGVMNLKSGPVLMIPVVALALYSAARRRESHLPVPPALAGTAD